MTHVLSGVRWGHLRDAEAGAHDLEEHVAVGEVEPKYHRSRSHRILEVPSPTWLGYTLQQPQGLLEAAGKTPLGPVEEAASLCAVPILHPSKGLLTLGPTCLTLLSFSMSASL